MLIGWSSTTNRRGRSGSGAVPVLECDLCRLRQGCAIFAKAPRQAGKQGAIATQACQRSRKIEAFWLRGQLRCRGGQPLLQAQQPVLGGRAAMAQHQSGQLAGIDGLADMVRHTGGQASLAVGW